LHRVAPRADGHMNLPVVPILIKESAAHVQVQRCRTSCVPGWNNRATNVEIAGNREPIPRHFELVERSEIQRGNHRPCHSRLQCASSFCKETNECVPTRIVTREIGNQDIRTKLDEFLPPWPPAADLLHLTCRRATLCDVEAKSGSTQLDVSEAELFQLGNDVEKTGFGERPLAQMKLRMGLNEGRLSVRHAPLDIEGWDFSRLRTWERIAPDRPV